MDRAIAPAEPVDWKSDEMAQRRKRRYAADRRLRIYGMIAIGFALGFLAILIATLSSHPATGDAKPTVPQYTPRRRCSQPLSS